MPLVSFSRGRALPRLAVLGVLLLVLANNSQASTSSNTTRGVIFQDPDGHLHIEAPANKSVFVNGAEVACATRLLASQRRFSVRAQNYRNAKLPRGSWTMLPTLELTFAAPCDGLALVVFTGNTRLFNSGASYHGQLFVNGSTLDDGHAFYGAGGEASSVSLTQTMDVVRGQGYMLEIGLYGGTGHSDKPDMFLNGGHLSVSFL